MSATAIPSSGSSISKVEFFNGSTLLGTTTWPVFSYIWTNVAAGNYTLTAKATDNQGGTATSSAITVTVNAAANALPIVILTAPANGASYTAPASINLSAYASDIDGTISKVEFYNGSTLLGTSTSSPYGFAWTCVAAGGYTITAKATDNLGAATTSSVSTVTVNAATPTYSISGNTGISGVTVSAGCTSVTSDASGNYTISGFATGTYTVTPSKAGYTFSPSSSSVTLGPNATGKNFAPTAVTYSISGNAGISGVSVSAGGTSVTSDASGNYTINGLAAGTYTVTPSKAGHTFSPSSSSVTLGPKEVAPEI